MSRARPGELARAAGPFLLVAALLAGCSDGDDSAADRPTPTPRATASPSSASPSDPATDRQTRLRLGQRASVVYHPEKSQSRRYRVRVLNVRRGLMSDLDLFRLTDRTRRSTLYYSDVRATNIGRRNAGGTALRLFGLDARGVVLPPVRVRGPYPRCDTRGLPERFGPGDSLRTCLVYLAPRHGRLRAVQVRYGRWDGLVSWQVAGQVKHRHKNRASADR
jgi:hypothetical protein